MPDLSLHLKTTTFPPALDRIQVCRSLFQPSSLRKVTDIKYSLFQNIKKIIFCLPWIKLSHDHTRFLRIVS